VKIWVCIFFWSFFSSVSASGWARSQLLRCGGTH